MNFPIDLKTNLETELSKIPRAILAKASDELSQRYRSGDRDKFYALMSSDIHRLSYLAVRMPATYAVVRRVLIEIQKRMPLFLPKSICDIGAGPGTASWAAADVFSEIIKGTLYEKDAGWLTIGKLLMKQTDSFLQSAEWITADLSQFHEFIPCDLTILSYVIGELPLEKVILLLENLWKTSKMIVIIEPGTPRGFDYIRVARDKLIQLGAFLVAPCPHNRSCPMPKGDWCHFVERLERSSLHMSIKEVDRGFEDEKYSYIVVSKEMINLPENRILRYPQRHSGHIDFTLCAKEGLEKRTLSKKQGDLYKRAKKQDWGDILPIE